MKTKRYWFDHNKQIPKFTPPFGIEVQFLKSDKNNQWENVFFVGISSDGYFMVECEDSSIQYAQLDDLRPLDWNKNQKKVVGLSWLLKGKWDVEVFDSVSNQWVLAEIIDGIVPTAVALNGIKLRPRINHPMVLTQEQVDLIPEGFDFSYENLTTSAIGVIERRLIVVFKSIKDGWCFPCEVDND